MTDLFKNTPQSSGFNTSSFGQTPNKIYGLLQCIGNVSAEKCSDCAQQANNSLHEVCANSIGALIVMDDCFLRYDNSNFISILDINQFISLSNVNSISGNMDDFKATTSSLLYKLSNLAYNPANKRFSIGSASYSPSHNVYGLVQCWRDLSINVCRKCLFTARNTVENCCSAKEGAQAISPSCTVSFEIYQFFDTIQSSSPLPSPEGSSAQIQSKSKHNHFF
ncbi:cysteine-rich repeat secretory protein 38-like [Cryptomeria japonica]|uniref:cysteine-rich repeat secretory protein 38-like n=1 Tax=Cryptomeria japonica TaxID=3369 RepID=UPI0027DA1376|nr:cysteine-rich repeat secretory protein 38-like [Cryptomeria japonica]